MDPVTLEEAKALCASVLANAAGSGSPPLAVAVLDARGSVKALMAQDGAPPALPSVAVGKGSAAIAYSADGVELAKVAAAVPFAVGGLSQAAVQFVPLPGSVLLRRNGSIVGTLAVAGDTPERDDELARAAIAAIWSDKA